MRTPNDQRQAIAEISANVVAKTRLRYCGFSLIELMIVLVILGIVAGFAYPSYQDQMRKSRRASGLSALMDASARQEQFFLNNKTYAATGAAAAFNMTALGYQSDAPLTEGGYYALSATIPTTPPASCDPVPLLVPPFSCYTLTATPQGAQTEDSCGDLTFSSDGDKNPAGCW